MKNKNKKRIHKKTKIETQSWHRHSSKEHMTQNFRINSDLSTNELNKYLKQYRYESVPNL